MPSKVRCTPPAPRHHTDPRDLSLFPAQAVNAGPPYGTNSHVTHAPVAWSNVTAPDGFSHAPGLLQSFPCSRPRKPVYELEQRDDDRAARDSGIRRA